MLPCTRDTSKIGLVLKPKSLPPLKIVDCIAEGGFSIVYKARSDTKYFVVKRVKKRRAFHDIRLRYHKWKKSRRKKSHRRRESQDAGLREVNEEEILKEISVLRLSQHKYVLEFFDSVKSLGSYWLVTEYCVCSVSDLSELPPQPIPLTPLLLVGHLMIPMFDAVAHLNSRGYMHLDIKPDNILVSSLGVPKLADFGLAEEYPGEPVKVIHRHGTNDFMAPEMHLKDSYNFSYDTWSLGYTMLHLVIRTQWVSPLRVKYKELTEKSGELQANVERFLLINSSMDSDFRSLIGPQWIEIARFLRKVVIFDWKLRPTPSQATQFPLAQKVLQSWKGRENSELFKESSDALWARIDEYVGRDSIVSPSEWSEIA